MKIYLYRSVFTKNGLELTSLQNNGKWKMKIDET